MSSDINDILIELGWEDGFQIPVSNYENKLLEQEVAKLSLQKAKAKQTFEHSSQKLENLENHVKHVNEESEESQNLITAQTRQLHNEEENFKLCESEKTKLEQEIRQFNKKILEIGHRQELKKNQLEKSAIKLEKLKSETNWDAEALKAWEESLQKREDDNQLIKKFSKEDERRYNELEAKRQHLEVEYAERKQTIEKMVSDLTNYERILDRTGKTMKQQLTERNALIQQWKDSVRILQQRDCDINRLQNKIIELSEVIEKEKEKLDDATQFYQNEMRNNEEIEFETQQLNAINSKMRHDLGDLSQNVLLLNGQADTLRRNLTLAAKHLQDERSTRKNLSNEIAMQETRIKKYQESIDKLRQKHIQIRTGSTAEDRIHAIQKMIDYEQKQQKILNNDDKILQSTYYRIQQDLQEEVRTQKNKQLSIYGMQANIKHLRKHNEERRNAVNQQKESVYELDYKIDEVHNKIFMLENATTYNVDRDELENKFAELEAEMSEHTEVKNLLKDQVNKIQDDMRRLTTAIASDQKQLMLLQDKLLHQQLSFEGGQKQLAQTKTTVQQKQVEESILLLRLNGLNKAMKKEKQNIYTLEKLKLNLEQATKSRLVEIDTHKDILLVRRRNLIEDRGRLKSDISQRLLRMDQFQKKYNITLLSLGKDEFGEPLSVTHFKIKNAQEKFLLQNEGDELDGKIKKAEKEIVAMENTLKVVNLTNVKFKHSLDAVDENSAEMNELKKLESEILHVNFALRQKRKECEKKYQKIHELKPVLEENAELNECEMQDYKELEEEYIKAETDKLLKEHKLEKAKERFKAVEKKVTKSEAEKYNKNLEISQLKEVNYNIQNRLLSLCLKYPETAPKIHQYLDEYGLEKQEKRSLTTISIASSECNSFTTLYSGRDSSSSKESVNAGRQSTSSSKGSMSKVVIKFKS